MIQLFDLSQQKGKLFDPYFQIEIDFASITLFATTNNADELSPLFRNKVVVRKLEKFTPAEKEQILTLKSRQIEKEWGVSTREIYSPNIISELSHLPEEGVRQSEAVLHEILKQ
jgi:ATP-dependent Lon protease